VQTRSESSSLWDLVPPFRRARGSHLYDLRGRRYLDLYLDASHAILGHRSEGLLAEVKAVLARGGMFEMPSIYPGRLARALARAYPAFSGVSVTRGPAEAAALAARYLKCRVDEVVVSDPAIGESGSVVLDRPFLPAAQRQGALDGAQVVLPILPCRTGGGPCGLLFRGPAPECEPAGWIAPAAAAAALKAFYDAVAFEPPAWWGEKGLLAGCRSWTQRGPYVAPLFVAERYEAVFRRFLDRGVLLPPGYPGPAVLPCEASKGELALLAQLFREEV
jgi:hypothetical protein